MGWIILIGFLVWLVWNDDNDPPPPRKEFDINDYRIN